MRSLISPAASLIVELVARKGFREGFIRYRLIPQFIAFFSYHVSWLLYVIRPSYSYMMNAHFEDHAEHEYMEFVAENPALEAEPFVSVFAQDYGSLLPWLTSSDRSATMSGCTNRKAWRA
jgi:ubiquinol oxidase